MARKLKRTSQLGKKRKASRAKKSQGPIVAYNIAPTLPKEAQPKDDFYRARVLAQGLSFNQDTYEFSDKFVPSNVENPREAHTFVEMVAALKKHKNVEIDAQIVGQGGKRERIQGREAFLRRLKDDEAKLKENDFFATDSYGSGYGTVNSYDFVPLLGGPFYKQLYIHDYLRMNSACFFAWHHDPVAKAIIDIYADFVFGRGFTVQCDDPFALGVWDAFAKVNNIETFMKEHFIETEVYGESMIWKLPHNEMFISYQRDKKQIPPDGILPRMRLIDPSCIWEIITYPEDIKQVLYYQWVSPTQYQMYTAPDVPSLKFIFSQIPAKEVLHVKINCASNEKRGRSSLFAVLGYLKRLRDSVNYSLVAMQKAAAWAIDTTIDGNQADIDNYQSSVSAQGTFPPAGSEFIHSKKVTREYLSNTSASKGGNSNTFDWCLSMIAAGTGIPISYLGTHLSGGQTRASAMVSTEPAAKMFEAKRLRVENTIKELFKWVTGESCTVIFPELISTDSSVKMKDISSAEDNGYISKKRAADMTAQELNIQNFNYEKEQEDIQNDLTSMMPPQMNNPLTAPPQQDAQQDPKEPKQFGLTNKDKKQVTDGKYS